jgi:hypothetical protein
MVAKKNSKGEAPKLRAGTKIQHTRQRPDVTSESQADSPNPPKDDDRAQRMTALGTRSPDFVKGLLAQLVSAAERGQEKYDLKNLLFTLAVAKGANATNEMETMLVTQMAAIHAAIMNYVGVLERAELLPLREHALRGLNHLARTYTAQLDALTRHRAGAEQNVTVQNVSVSEGGQAIVGNVNTAPPTTVPETVPPLVDVSQSPTEILEVPELVPVTLQTKRAK